VGEDATGGLLAVPVADTLKRASREGRVMRTELREELWQAQTPQMFRCRLLVEALRVANPSVITDESGAIEHLGLHPKTGDGRCAQPESPYPQDLALAELILRNND